MLFTFHSQKMQPLAALRDTCQPIVYAD